MSMHNNLSKTVISKSQFPTSPLKRNNNISPSPSRTTPLENINDDDLSQTKIRIKKEFETRFINLDTDIDHIDGRMKHIQQFCTNLELQVKNLQTLVNSDNNSAKKGQYYQIINSCMELNATYEQLYIRCMELKQRYRKEQDDLHSRISRFVEFDMVKANLDVADQNLTPSSLALMMQDLTSAILNNDKKAVDIKASLQELEDDPDYKL